MKSLILLVVSFSALQSMHSQGLTFQQRFTYTTILFTGDVRDTFGGLRRVPTDKKKGSLIFMMRVQDRFKTSDSIVQKKDEMILFAKTFVLKDSFPFYEWIEIAYCRDNACEYPAKLWHEYFSMYKDTPRSARERLTLLLDLIPFKIFPTKWDDSVQIYLEEVPGYTPKKVLKDEYINIVGILVHYFVFDGGKVPFAIHLRRGAEWYVLDFQRNHPFEKMWREIRK